MVCSMPLHNLSCNSDCSARVGFLGAFVCRYHSGDVYIIDVSQAVEHDHPHALEFLRKDCANVNGEWAALQLWF